MKTLLLLCTYLLFSYANSNMTRCNDERIKEHINYQILYESCFAVAEENEINKNYGRASWYYLLSGESKKNIDVVEKKMFLYAKSVNIAHSYVLDGNLEKAEKRYRRYLKMHFAPKAYVTVKNDYKILFKLYPQKREVLEKGWSLWERIYKPFLFLNESYRKYKTTKSKTKSMEYLLKIIEEEENYCKKNKTDKETILYALKRADAYGYVAILYESMRAYDKSLEYYKKILEIREKVLDKEHPLLAESYEDLGYFFWKRDNFSDALKFHKKALAIQEKVLGKEHYALAVTYNNMALVYNDMGSYKKAINFYEKALNIFEKAVGDRDYTKAIIYQNLGSSYKIIGAYSKALNYFQKSLKIKEKSINQEMSRASLYIKIGDVYDLIGDYDTSFDLYKKSLLLRRKVVGEERLPIAESYVFIGRYYQRVGDYTEAINYYQKSLKIREKILHKNSELIAESYNNLSSVYGAMGDYNMALDYAKKSLSIRENIFGEEDIKTARSYLSVGSQYRHKEEYKKAIINQEKALAIAEKLLGGKHLFTVAIYNNLGQTYYAMNMFDKALKYYRKALVIRKKILGNKHVDIALTYDNIAHVYFSIHEYDNAMNYLKKALQIEKELLGTHPFVGETLFFMSKLYEKMDEPQKAYSYALKSFENFIFNRDKSFGLLNNRQKKLYLKVNHRNIVQLLRTATSYIQKDKKKSETIKKEILNAWLNVKGTIFDSENAIFTLYHNSKDMKLKKKIDTLVYNKRLLAKLYQSLPKPKEKESWQENIKKVEHKILQLTKEISSNVSTFSKENSLKSISYKEISHLLKKDELYIDYVKLKRNYYLFSLDSLEHITFTKIDAKSSKKIDLLIKRFRDDVQTILKDHTLSDESLKLLTVDSKKKLSLLYELVLKTPLSQVLNNKRELTISTDGALRLLPFEALFDKEHKGYLIENKEIRYIPSGKEFLRLYKYAEKHNKEKDGKSTVIFSNPNFNSKLDNNDSLDDENTTLMPSSSRKGIIKSLFRMKFGALPGTKEEAASIKTILNQKNIIEYKNEEASEKNLMQVQHPLILHIATHGFFINDKAIPNAMLKSGIALSGANKSLIKGRSEGVITALKLSGLNLTGTDLVVLSACQTGVVDINSTESVSGLSKAFIQAGAKDIILTLWSVNDTATKDLMHSFYEGIKEDKTYTAALKEAKIKMIKHDKHPFYWAPFIINGL